MSCCRGCALFCSICLGLSACREDPPPTPKRTEPWPAPAASSAALPDSALVEYELRDHQRLDFELKTRSTKIVGYFPVLRGSLKVDLMRLEQSRAKLEIDLASVRIEAEDEQEHETQSATASNWLNLGSSIPEAAREGRRWASFEIGEVLDVSAHAAHEGRIERRAKKPPKAATEGDAEAPAATGEVRKVFAKVRGPFSMNQRRMSEDASVSVSFSYPAEATPGYPPDEIQVKSTRTVGIPLEPFGVEPRNAAGVVIASDTKLLGSTVSRLAKISFTLKFRRPSDPH